MAAVLRYDQATVSPSSPTSQRFDAPDMRATKIGIEQGAELGRNMQGLGHDLAQIDEAKAEQTNHVFVTNALNQVREAADNLTYDPKDGYTTVKGADVYKDPARPLAVDYAGRLDKAIGEAGATLTNDAQKRLFQEQAAGVRASFYEQAFAHENREWQAHTLSTFAGSTKLSADTIGRSTEPDVIARELASMDASVTEIGKLKGQSATEIAAERLTVGSAALTNAILTQLDAGNLTGAAALRDRFKDRLSADDLLKLNTHINGQLDTNLGTAAGDAAFAGHAMQAAPGDFATMVSITAQTESGGKDFNADGSVVTSKKGARGSMQVMPGTERDPGFGMKPLPANATPEQRAAHGAEYLHKMLQRYGGDPAKAWAAYNAGPGALDAALAASRKDGSAWLSHLPGETQGYVAKNMAKLGQPSGGNQYAKLDPEAMYGTLRQNPLLANNPKAMKAAQEQIDHRVAIHNQSIEAAKENNSARILQGLMQNGGNWNALPASLRALAPPEDVEKFIDFGRKWAKGEDKTDPAAYQHLSNPDYLRSLSDVEMAGYRSSLSEQDWKQFAAKRAELRSGKGDNGPDSPPDALKGVLDTRLSLMGVDINPKHTNTEATSYLGAVRKTVADAVLNEQRTRGKQMTHAELSDFVDRLFGQTIAFDNYFFGLNTGRTSERALGMHYTDIPSGAASDIRQGFIARGVSNPSHADILQQYWREHMPMFRPRPKAKKSG